MGEIAATKRRYGYRRIHVLLRREGWDVNRKKTYRLYREMGLAVRRRKRKRIGPFERVPLPKPSATNQSWSMDFIADGLADGRRLRCLVIVDDYSRECLVIEVDTSITGTRVAAVLDRIAEDRGLPASITVDHGPEFEGQVLDAWAYARGVRLSFIRPGARGERLHRELQRQVPRRVSERALVRHDGACAPRDRELEDRIQHRASAQLARRSNADRVCGALAVEAYR